MESKKSINSFEMRNRISHLIIYETIIVLANSLITFRYYSYAQYSFLTSLIWLIIQIFFISRSTEILIVLNFWLEVYT